MRVPWDDDATYEEPGWGAVAAVLLGIMALVLLIAWLFVVLHLRAMRWAL